MTYNKQYDEFIDKRRLNTEDGDKCDILGCPAIATLELSVRELGPLGLWRVCDDHEQDILYLHLDDHNKPKREDYENERADQSYHDKPTGK